MAFLEIRGNLLKYRFEHIDINRLNKLIFRIDPMKIRNLVYILNRNNFKLSGTRINNKREFIVHNELLILHINQF